jgi:hypothetical protein
MITSKTKLAIGLCALLGVSLAAMVYLRDIRPVLFRVNPDPGMIRPRSYCVLNPLRDRAPERAAEELLAKLRAGRREDLQRIVDADRRGHILMREWQYPIRGWRLCWRVDGPRVSTLGYWVTRARCEGEEEVWLDLSCADRWAVTGFSAMY